MRRLDRVDLLFVAAAAAAGALILGLGAGLTFFADEWAFIETRALADPTTWFVPHNEHWATLSILVYRALVETIGIGSYMPYLAMLLVLHLSVATLVYQLIRRSSGPWLALAASAIVLVLGGGFENLLWAFQIGFVGSVLAGLAAILVFDASPLTPRRAALGVVLILASLASSGGTGIICCVAVGLELLLDERRRAMAVLLAFPAAVYGAWYVTIGRIGIEAHEGVFQLGGLSDVPPFVFTGLSTLAGTIVGVGIDLGRIVLIVAILAAVVAAARRRTFAIAPRAIACLVAILVFYALISLARSSVGVDTATLTRYTYVSTILLLVGLSAQVGQPDLTSPTARRAWMFGGALVLTLSLTWNIRLLVGGRELFADRAERTRALVTVALELPLPATTDPDRSLVLVPSPSALARIVRAYGSPLGDQLVPWAVAPIRPEVLADAERVLREGAEIPLPEPEVR